MTSPSPLTARWTVTGPLALLLVGVTVLTFMPSYARAELASHAFLPARFPPPAGAPKPLLPEHSLTGFGTPDRSFDDPCGLAVDSGGDIFVSDYYHHAVDVFNALGEFSGHIADEDPLGGPCGLAVDPAGNLYVNNWRRSVVKFTSGPTGYASGVTIDSNGSTGVTVDPATGDVYIDDGSYVAEYDSSGEPVLAGGEPVRIGLGSLGEGFGVAVSDYPATDGYVYVPDAQSGTVKIYDPTKSLTEPVEIIDGSQTPQSGFRHLGDASIAIDQATGHLFVVDQLVSHTDRPPAVVDEFDRFGNYRGQLPHALIAGVPTGIAIDGSGEIYVTTGSENGGGVYAFAPTSAAAALEVIKTGSGEANITSVPSGIDCGSTCASEFTKGKAVTLTASPDAHSAFLGWRVNGDPSACPSAGVCQVTLEADTEVSAEFTALPQQTLTVSKSGSGTGEVTSVPSGIDCGLTCASEFTKGKAVTLTASPDAHSAFLGWRVNGDPSACPSAGVCQVTLEADTEVSAEFTALPQQTLTVSKNGSGTGEVTSVPSGIDCGSTCTASYNQDSQVTLVAASAPDSAFRGWTGGGCSGTALCQLTLDKVTEVHASFESIQHNLMASVFGSGTGIISSTPAGIDCGSVCSHPFPEGAFVILTAHPTLGSAFTGWSGACAGKRSCQVTISQDTMVSAGFQAVQKTLTISLSGTGTGTVSDQPAQIKCGLACAGVYRQGTVLTLTAQPTPGSALAGWSGCTATAGNRCTVLLSEDKAVGAVFNESLSLTLGRATRHGASIRLKATVPGPGSLVVSGRGLKKVKVHARSDEIIPLRLMLSALGRRTLTKSHNDQLRVKVTVTFVPQGAVAITATKVVTFK